MPQIQREHHGVIIRRMVAEGKLARQLMPDELWALGQAARDLLGSDDRDAAPDPEPPRVRVRHRARQQPPREALSDSGVAAMPLAEEEQEFGVTESRLALVLDMRAEGKTQEQIARHFGKSVRTIQRWEEEARRLGIRPFRDRQPFHFVRETIDRLEARKAALEEEFWNAKAEGSREEMRMLDRSIQQNELTKYRVLEASGYFEGRCFPESEQARNERMSREQDEQLNGLRYTLNGVAF